MTNVHDLVYRWAWLSFARRLRGKIKSVLNLTNKSFNGKLAIAISETLGIVSDIYIYTHQKLHGGSGYPNSVSISCGLYDSAWLRVPSKKNVTETIEARHALFDTKVAVKLGI